MARTDLRFFSGAVQPSAQMDEPQMGFYRDAGERAVQVRSLTWTLTGCNWIKMILKWFNSVIIQLL